MKKDPLKLYNALKEIYFWLDNGDRQLMDCYQLTIPRYYVLKHISENPGLSMTQLSGLMLSDKSNITRLIRSVEREHLVVRRPAEEDRRKTCLFLSDKGQDVLEKVTQAHETFVRERFSGLEFDEQTLLTVLGEIKVNLETQIKKNQST